MTTFRLIKKDESEVVLKDEKGEKVTFGDFLKQFPHKLILFIGDLGSGKTTFIRQICEELGCKSIVNSPTFSIINEYETAQNKIFHIDCYRLKDLDEAINSGIEEYLHSSNFCFIEWPDLIMSLITEEATVIKINVLKDGQRILEVGNYNPLSDCVE